MTSQSAPERSPSKEVWAALLVGVIYGAITREYFEMSFWPSVLTQAGVMVAVHGGAIEIRSFRSYCKDDDVASSTLSEVDDSGSET